MKLFNKEGSTELSIKTKNNTNNIENNTNNIVSLRRDVDNNDLKHDKQYMFLLNELNLLKLKTEVYENEKNEMIKSDKEEKMLEDKKGSNLTFSDVCKKIMIKNIKTANLKFYLYENGLLNMSINKDRNSFSLISENIKNINEDLMSCLHIANGQILFDNSFIEYANKNKEQISQSIKRYQMKQDQYKISMKNLQNRNANNYQLEIGKICGVKENYNKEKWSFVYKKFSEKYTTFFDDYTKYKAETPITVVAYVVTVMGEGNYLLKIACDLYV